MRRVILLGTLTAVLATGFAAIERGALAGERSAPATAEQKEAASALERDVVALLAAVDPAADLATLQTSLAPQLAAAVDRHFAALQARPEATVIESSDGRFVVVVIDQSAEGKAGKDVRATSDAELLLAVGGRAGPRPKGGKESYGGTGHAEATKGIGIGLGGDGGSGAEDGAGGGGGGGAGATGPVGAIALGGQGGAGNGTGGKGGTGSGVDPVRLDAIVKAAKGWEGKK